MDLPISLTSAGSINTTVESKIGWEPGRGGREGGGGGGGWKEGEREERREGGGATSQNICSKMVFFIIKSWKAVNISLFLSTTPPIAQTQGSSLSNYSYIPTHTQ